MQTHIEINTNVTLLQSRCVTFYLENESAVFAFVNINKEQINGFALFCQLGCRVRVRG
jgi:hypothetical protein